MTTHNPNFTGWCLIPPEILSSKDISANEKMIWGRIHGLKEKRGFCFASNKFLGESLGLDSGTVSNIISSLVKKKLLERVVIRDKKTKQIKERRLFPLLPLSINECIPINGTMDTPINGTMEERNRDIRNRISNTLSYLENIPEEDISYFTENFRISKRQLKEKGEELADYCRAKGKKYKNYKSFLRNAVRKEYGKKNINQSNEDKYKEIPINKVNLEKLAEIKAKIGRIKNGV